MLVIPETYEGKPVKEIGWRAFSDTLTLKELVLPDSITTIGDSAFVGCRGLARITLGKGLTALDEYCFNDCAVVEIYNRSSIPMVAGGEGYLQYNAKHIYGEGGESRITRDGGYMVYTEGDCKLLLGYLGTETKLTLPAGITEIGKYAFTRSKITEISVPDSVKVLGEGAFSSCFYLTKVTVGAGITVLPDYTFSGCMQLTSVILPDGLTTIERFVFSSCRALESITLPDSVTEIGMDAFSSCAVLKSVDLGAGLKKLHDNVFYDCAALEEITLPASLTVIYEKVFSKCSSLTRVIFEDTNGWTINQNPIDPAVFETPEAAAEALKNIYGNRIWVKKTA
ncbi:MAG: leucine-rich repeat domain-containing protein [Clostridia bacterium]|nr:leucine-rich repeat domain-containing protein [Clostridia bacterium]